MRLVLFICGVLITSCKFNRLARSRDIRNIISDPMSDNIIQKYTYLKVPHPMGPITFQYSVQPNNKLPYRFLSSPFQAFHQGSLVPI